jgi:membrane associated rhomboid family serine protease
MRRSPSLTEFSRYPVTAGTAMLAIGITIAWWAKMDVSSLFESAMIRRGELWRLVTCIFPHLSIWHLAFNIYWLWVFGTLIEQLYGHLKTAALILLFAIGSSAFEFALSSGGVGLSGVGYGLFGLLWILSKRDERFHDAIDSRTIQLFVGWFFICIFTTVTNIIPVANIAHGAGAVLGVLTGFALTLPRFRLSILAAMGSILLFGLWAATLGRPRVNLSASGGYEKPSGNSTP